ncbi:Regulatory protein leu3 [Cladophialophora chaetospira]|uniref:Regulatory protein leu3 n=1 Tax=Cladophialophora chaetospira TaxID=386627 RepID=A0AA38X3B7_9EURO|nr:Regulatory protein leu3 [Cladophialophora chaetospira]
MMSSRIEELQQALRNKSPSNTLSSQPQELVDVPVSTNWASHLPSIGDTIAIAEPPMNLPALVSTASISSAGTSSTAHRTLGTVCLTYGQVNEHFKNYFARCHQYLPFKMTTHSADAIYTRCELLFWVIITTAASWKLRSQLAPSVQGMLTGIIHSFPRSVEQVQALLIMSMWPFPVSSVMEDVSHCYCCLATQMALHLGLHRPNQTHLHEHGMEERENARAVGEEVKTTTWLSCFIVNQKLSATRGLPPSILVDVHLLDAFENKSINPTLSQLCRIYHVLMQSNLAISANGSTPSGMLEPASRLSMMKVWSDHFSSLKRQHLQQTDNVVNIAFLSARLQLWSFALLEDMPMSSELAGYIDNARQDASELIELCYSKNLSAVPACIRHAMCYCAFVLVKILRSGYSTETEVLQDDIERVRQALSTTISSPDEVHRKASETIRKLLYIEDRKLSPPIHTRMGASVIYDLLRIYAEDKYGGIPCQADNQTIDLEGFDWNFLDMLGYQG